MLRPKRLVFFEYESKGHTAFVSADESDQEAVKKAKEKVVAYQRLFNHEIPMTQVAPADVLSAPPGALEKAEMKPVENCCCLVM